MTFDRIKIGGRLAIGFGSVLLLTLAMAAVGVSQLFALSRLDDQASAQSDLQQIAEQWRGAAALNHSRTLSIAKSGVQPELVAFLDPLLKQTSAEIGALAKKLEAGLGAEGPAAIAEIAAKRKSLFDVREPVLALVKAKDPAAQQAVDTQLIPVAEAYMKAVDALVLRIRERGDALDEEVHTVASHARWVTVGFAGAALTLGVLVAWIITRSIVRPLREAVSTTKVIAAGDLTARIEAQRGDEIGELQKSLLEMQQSLRRIISSVRDSSQNITTASSEIAIGNADLSNRTEQTASNLQQTASSMEQLTGTVKQTADSARTANQLASSAQATAAKGGDVVTQVVATMEDINSSSKKIADIIGVIDGIAFQTNILALNAAVEAARAGEQGRGFAVVAGEVRNLAQRSAQAAKEIKQLIGASVEKVESGTRLVADAGQTMSEIVQSVQRVTDIIGEITAAAAEQSEGIGQVNGAVTTLDQMTQQNAALVEQSAAAAESLKDQAGKLARSMAVFKIAA